MRWRILFGVCLVSLIPSQSRADGPKDPLRFIPAQAEAVVKIERPRALLDAVEQHELVKEALKITGVRELYDSTNYRRLNQLIAYFEKELGKEKHEILDALTGGGVVFSAKFSNPAGVLLAIQSRDEKTLKQFAMRLLDLAEKELARQEIKEPIRRTEYAGALIVRFGPVNAALVDGALLVASEEKILKSVLDQNQERKQGERIAQSENFREARKSIPDNAQLWAWVDLNAVKQLPKFKTGFEAGAQDPNVTILFGGLVDVIKRSPYVTAFLAQEKNDWRFRVQMPRGREGMSGIGNMILPQKDAGSLPLLQPPRAFASLSYFLDLGKFWENRDKIFNKQQVEQLNKAEEQSAKFLGGAKLGTLFNQMGNHQRVVFATQEKSPYKTKPTTQIPAFAIVIDMRDPAFGNSMNFILRGVALVGSFAGKTGLKMVEEEHAGQKLVCYYFPEDKALEGDPSGIRFNFSPCFVQVSDQLVMSSTVVLGRDLIDEIKRGNREPAQPATMRTQLYATGAAQGLRAGEEQVLTQLILGQAFPPAAAREEFRKITALVERLGTLGFEINYGQNDFRFDVKWRYSK